MGRPATLKRIIDLVKKVKSRNPDVQLFLDPVMGDNQRLYVPPEVVPLYRELCAWADFVFPNGFEAEYGISLSSLFRFLLTFQEIRILTEIPVRTTKNGLEALQKLHELGAKNVIITSTELHDKDSQRLYLLASIENDKDGNESKKPFMIDFPKRTQAFTGTGDLLAALVLGYLGARHPLRDVVKEVTEKATSVMQAVLEETLRVAPIRLERFSAMKSDVAKERKALELCIIQCKSVIENPLPDSYRACDNIE